ncbi:MAG: DUF1893 domain-containing protein [Acutalibacteraceae bacterium]|uniref:DUF1893 domain-containing protein n=1 Tax=Faecalispora jeddahensis TaxID=1414721 RepID=UPI0027B91EEF|nr:DUF1893 domain-containing protein [Faecalispora jeddahensis]
MNNDIVTASQYLKDKGYTCVFCREDTMYSSTERGVKPLLDFIENGPNLRGFSAADKIVGKAAALLYVLLGVKEVYAPVMSETALYTLAHNGILPLCDCSVKSIRNRSGTGACPMEETVVDIDEPRQAVIAIQNKLNILKERRDEP